MSTSRFPRRVPRSGICCVPCVRACVWSQSGSSTPARPPIVVQRSVRVATPTGRRPSSLRRTFPVRCVEACASDHTPRVRFRTGCCCALSVMFPHGVFTVERPGGRRICGTTCAAVRRDACTHSGGHTTGRCAQTVSGRPFWEAHVTLRDPASGWQP